MLGLPGVRDGLTTTFTRYTYGWLGAATPDGSVAVLGASDVGVDMHAFVPSYRGDGVRVLASS